MEGRLGVAVFMAASLARPGAWRTGRLGPVLSRGRYQEIAVPLALGCSQPSSRTPVSAFASCLLSRVISSFL